MANPPPLIPRARRTLRQLAYGAALEALARDRMGHRVPAGYLATARQIVRDFEAPLDAACREEVKRDWRDPRRIVREGPSLEDPR